MDVSTEELIALLDRRDAGLISESFWPDATIDLGIFAGSFGDYLEWVVPGSPAIPVTQHVLGQTVIEHSGFPPQLVRAISRHLRTKVLFGTDYPYIKMDRWRRDFDGLDIDPTVVPLIFKDNALRVLGITA